MSSAESDFKKLVITNLDRLDDITLYIEDYEPGKGKITIECYGESWSYFWGGMSGQNISGFFISCNVSYLLNCLWDHSKESSEFDYEDLQSNIRKWVLESRRESFIEPFEAREVYDIDDWESYAPEHQYDTWTRPSNIDESTFEKIYFTAYEEIPQKSTKAYSYLARIIEAIRNEFIRLENLN